MVRLRERRPAVRRERETGFTLIELMIVVAIIAIIAAIAIPSLLGARKSGNEASAIASCRTLATVSEQYKTRFQSYANSLASLSATGYIDEVLGSGSKSGYTFTYAGATDTWTVAADAETFGTTGDRGFFIDSTGVIRFADLASATSASAPID
ncbi:MAG: prepilin-type N-terminal cleavage/methylation domain-containing protein [Planctomycetes bacterium]|nr:prepilin-type N-terminal cleavage/methylation domain-containing protein [Planctomycetota bacterium]